MAVSEILTKAQTLEVTAVSSVTVSEAQQGPETGLWVRELQIKGSPVTEGGAPTILTIRLSSETKASINMTAPTQTY
ncbi:MAG: hypothetical protein KAG89_20290 [Fulvimarina manganoxydans]|uniref:hypothetical protein n=1 Tax=Fulvimarina manganoxydans TaxID=937218 RepID=UPI0023559D70|nr:hypothetical protein [Fulvimarina manganoxydans]MCK5934499.1 hypothetical protein [Fulvimarina manganoxydans]